MSDAGGTGTGDTVAKLWMATTAGSARSGRSGVSLGVLDSSTLLSSCSSVGFTVVLVLLLLLGRVRRRENKFLVEFVDVSAIEFLIRRVLKSAHEMPY